MNKVITIFSPKMAGYLLDNGCILITKRPDLMRPDRIVFVFQDTSELRQLMNMYSGG